MNIIVLRYSLFGNYSALFSFLIKRFFLLKFSANNCLCNLFLIYTIIAIAAKFFLVICVFTGKITVLTLTLTLKVILYDMFLGRNVQ